MTGPSFDLKDPRAQESLIVGLAALAAGAVAAWSGAAPTGTRWWDATLCFVLAALVVVAASKAPRWAIIVVTAVAAASTGLSIWMVVGWLGLLVALASALLIRRSRAVGALATALAVAALFNLPAFGAFGLPSVVAGACFVLLLVMGYRFGTKFARRAARIGVAALAVGVTLIAAIGGAAVLSARSDVDRGVSAAQRGLEAVRAGDTETVAQQLERAEEALTSAEASVDGFAARSLLALPIAAQHHRMLDVATGQGASIAREAAAVVSEADVETIRLTSGQVDLAALQAMGPRLRSTLDSLEQASASINSAQSPWLLPFVDDRVDELLVEVDSLLPEARLAVNAVDVVPAMLGNDGPRHYFVMFGTPAESRELGGLLGSWAIIRFDQGRLELVDSARISALYDLAAANPSPEAVVSNWFMEMARPNEFPQNLTSSPDIAVVADAASRVLAGAGGVLIDGYIYMDTWALIDLLQLTGPVSTPLQDEPLTHANAPKFFFEDQYLLDDNRTEIFSALSQVASSILSDVQATGLPGPEALGQAMGPAARAGRLQMVTFNEAENDFLRSIKLLRDFDSGGALDSFAIVQTNATASKLDLYLRRSIRYDINVGEDGSLRSTIRVELRSAIPESAPQFTFGREAQGQNRLLVSFYTQHQAVPGSARVNGQTVPLEFIGELGYVRYLLVADVPPTDEPIVLEVSFEGQTDPDLAYSVHLWHQPLVNTDQYEVIYRGPSDSFEWQGEIVENTVISGDGARPAQ